jgi:menaquinone-specific isochorismate synthase
MLAPIPLLDQLRARIDESISALPLDAAEGLASLVLDLPVIPAVAPEIPNHRFALMHGRNNELRAGYGIAAEWQAQGPTRLSELRMRAQRLAEGWHHWDPDETGFTGFGLLGLAADPGPGSDSDPGVEGPGNSGQGLPNAVLWVPEIAVASRGCQAALILSTALPASESGLRKRWLGLLERIIRGLSPASPEPRMPALLRPLGSAPGISHWRRLVDAVLREIDRGVMDKAVLCRRIGLRGPRPFDLRLLQAALAWLFPTCQVIHVARGPSSFIAATPERLLQVRGGRVEVDAIAGTAARSASAEQDRALAEGLLRSAKDLREHALVVEAVRSTLSVCCTEVHIPDAPRLLKLHNAQHLWSPISARLGDRTDIFDLAERIHPTPATNGTPREAVRDWLRQNEPLARGWYTGVAGILGPDLSGELWVLLRCAEVRGNEARLYAGAGIVSGSDALEEWRETGHKLSAIATALRFA